MKNGLNLKFAILRAIRRSSYLYPFIKRLKDDKDSIGQYRLSSQDCDLCIEGYPSSGNSFLYTALQVKVPELKIAHHCHNVANMKLALRLGVPVVAVVRSPLDCIASNIVRFDKDLEDALRQYVDFYEYLSSKVNQILIMPFEDITSRIIPSLYHIEQSLERSEELVSDADDFVSKVKEEMVRWNAVHGDVNNMSLPSSERSELKRVVQQQLVEHHLYAKCLALYDEVRSSVDFNDKSVDR